GVHLSGDGARIYGEQIAHDLSAALGLLTSPRPCSLMILATGLGELRVALGGGGWCRPLSLAGAGNDVGRGGRRRARAPGERGGQPPAPSLAARERSVVVCRGFGLPSSGGKSSRVRRVLKKSSTLSRTIRATAIWPCPSRRVAV